MNNLGLSAILWEIISSNAWWNVREVSHNLGLSATSQGMLPRTCEVQINYVNYYRRVLL